MSLGQPFFLAIVGYWKAPTSRAFENNFISSRSAGCNAGGRFVAKLPEVATNIGTTDPFALYKRPKSSAQLDTNSTVASIELGKPASDNKGITNSNTQLAKGIQ